jgi:hypothetical protein
MVASKPTVGTRSTPDRHAKTAPMLHDSDRTRTGLVPAMDSRTGSSTTACIDRPSFVVRKNRYNPAAANSATKKTISWSTPTLTDRTSMLLVGR